MLMGIIQMQAHTQRRCPGGDRGWWRALAKDWRGTRTRVSLAGRACMPPIGPARMATGTSAGDIPGGARAHA